MSDMQIEFFESKEAFRAWLEKHHATERELWVGFHRKGSGRPSMTWPEAVDQALCFGWIDSIRKRVDPESYANRFTPRKKGSNWSAVNIKRVQELRDAGLMRPEGLAAFEARRPDRSGVYSYEQRSPELGEPYAGMLERNPAAATFFRAQPPSYRKLAVWWVMSAKREETRLKRLRTLVEVSAGGRRLPQFTRDPKAT